ncbi:MAG: hypothetical protein COU69_01105 [Candidatus Pacebacteria bacterium CG10_big_fil_rev_8_21_14_0_10_56_10]|nr:MAG: hypothetical protein COU69_01105 [Candidatus Pacebacteria bacterium CG10_big_fil_rev_8_21_14_0_10_56_10]
MPTGPLLSIIGPTATGKTQLALDATEWLADRMNGFDLISVDSRQVYRELAITSGADVPAGFERRQGYWQRDRVRLYGVGIISADQDWSVAQFGRLARRVAAAAWRRRRLPVLIGGTGLYHRWALGAGAELNTPPDPQLRRQAAKLRLDELQDWLARVDRRRWAAMNRSDRHNARRLIRAIEQARAAGPARQTGGSLKPQPHLQLGLERPLDHLAAVICRRVVKRLEAGAQQEVTSLLARHGLQVLDRPAGSTAGVRDVWAYIQGKLEYDQLIDRWARRELQYAKRQLSWWRADEAASAGGRQWFDVTAAHVRTMLKAAVTSLESVHPETGSETDPKTGLETGSETGPVSRP